MPVKTTLEKRGAKDARISTGGKEKERFTLCLAVMQEGPATHHLQGHAVHPAGSVEEGQEDSAAGRGPSRQRLPLGVVPSSGTPWGACRLVCRRTASVTRGSAPFRCRRAGEASPRQRKHHQASPEHLGVGRLRVPPRQGLYRRPRENVQYQRHPDPGRSDSSTPAAGPRAQQADKAATAGELHHLHRHRGCRPHYGRAETARPWDGVYVVPAGVGSNHPGHDQDLLQICGLTLALDGSEDHAWCMHNFGEGYRELPQGQRVEPEKAHPGVSLPPLQLPEVPDGEPIDTNPITAAEKEVQGRRLPPADREESDSDVELLKYDIDLEFLGVSGGGEKEGE
ncbi:unnamed protein product [Ectocarpus sp. 12 AP-2014]